MAQQSTAFDQVAQDKTLLGGYAYQIIRQQSKRVFKLRSPVLADTDIESLHEMRVGTRRLRSALNLFADVVEIDSPAEHSPAEHSGANSTSNSSANSSDSVAKAVGKLTKALGKVRDLDVMQAWFEQTLAASKGADTKTGTMTGAMAVGALNKSEKKVIKAILKKLKKRRKKQFSRLEKTLGHKAYKKLAHRLKQWIKQPVFSAAARQPASREAIVRMVTPLTGLLQHSGWLVATRKQGKHITPIDDITLPKLNQCFEEEGETLHELRKEIKGIRYQMEFFRGLYDITYAAQVREFRNIQDLLGQLQDQVVFAQFLNDELGPDWAQQLPTIAAAFQGSRLDLWQQWQPYQRQYLQLRNQLPAAISAA